MNVYDVITETIIKKLESGTIPWQRVYQGIQWPPMNFKSKKMYKGINLLLLGMTGHRSPYWLTYKQSKDLGGQVKKGSKGHKILFAKMTTYTDADGNEQDKAIYKYSNVFNVDDIDDIECPYMDQYDIEQREVTYIENCETAIKQMVDSKRIAPITYHDLQISAYNPGIDVIKSCMPENFISDEEYYSTLFHEIIHSTGHVSRLNRVMTGGKKSKEYAKEELSAEIGSCFLCGITGITTATIDNSAAYIQSWLKNLRDDPKLVVQAASKAQKAMDWLDVKL